jgi:hypothetical protein
MNAKMTKPALSVLTFGVYMIFQGLTLFVVPNILLSLFGFESSNEVWIRILGVALIALGYYYIQNAKANYLPFFSWTVQVRTLQLILIGSLVFLQIAPLMLIVISGTEFLFGVWTWWALKADAKN